MSTPAGWYDDGHGTQRWWDGAAWTEHVQPPAPEAAAQPAPEAAAQPVSAPETPAPDRSIPDITAAPAAPAETYPDAAATPQYPSAPGYPSAPAQPAYAAQPGTESAPAQPGYAAQPGAAAGYPGGSPATAAYPGAPGQPPTGGPEKKSKLWILWVVLGGIVLLLIVAAAILIPLLIGLFSAGSAGGSDDERAAVDVVRTYDDAFDEVDCDLYEESTTSNFRENFGYADCDAFTSGAEEFGDNTDEYEVEVTGVETQSDGTIVVTTRETYLSYLDDEGEQLDTPEPSEDPFTYTLVEDGGRWAIDDVQ